MTEALSARKRALRRERQPRSLLAQLGQGLNAQREKAAVRRSRPGVRGWPIRGGGRAPWITPPVEFEGTANMVCGLWPFAAGSGLPAVGVPLGPHLETAATVCADPVSWFLAKLILNPSAFILGKPALGKSTLLRRMCIVLPAWGITPMILSDTKGEHVDLVRSQNGQVIRLGRGLGAINPLDVGPLASMLHQLPTHLQQEVKADLRGRRENTLHGLLELARRARLDALERTVLNAALRELDPDLACTPLLGDIRRMIEDRHPALRAVVRDRGNEDRFDSRTEALLDALQAIDVGGQFGDTFAEQTSDPVDMDRAVVFDMSSVDDTDELYQAALQLVCWSYGAAAIQCAKVMADAGLAPQRIYLMVMDELWRVIRASSLMVDRIDALTRLNRQRGLGQIMVTHTMNDLKLDTESDTSKAWGFVERSAMVFLGGLGMQEMGNLATVFGMSDREQQMIDSWADDGGFDPTSNVAAEPAGRGKFLLKLGTRPGIPFRLLLSPLEEHLNDTNRRWHAAEAQRNSPGVGS